MVEARGLQRRGEQTRSGEDLAAQGAVQAIGLALLVLFFVIGVMKTCGSFADVNFC